jgi:hypothetical protein
MLRGTLPFLCFSIVLIQTRFVHGRTIRGLGNESNESSTSTLPGNVTFQLGDLLVSVPALGIRLSAGMSVRMIAKANLPVRLTARGRAGDYSNLKFHAMPDGADVFSGDDDGGYVYVSNSEMKEKLGGVYGYVLHWYSVTQ